MNGINVKQEIKEEIHDEIFNEIDYNEVYNDEMLLQSLKFENDEQEYYEYNNGHTNESDLTPNNENTSPKPDNVESEDVYIDDELEVCVQNFDQNIKDPLEIHTTIAESKPETEDQPIPKKSLKKVKLVRVSVKKFQPVKNLIQRTYSKQKTTSNISHTCATCKKQFDTNAELVEHKNLCFKCYKCNLIFANISRAKFKRHLIICMKKTETNALIKGRISTKIENPLVKSCNVCHTTFALQTEMEEHLKQKHPSYAAYACHLCDKKFDSFVNAHYHLNNDH